MRSNLGGTTAMAAAVYVVNLRGVEARRVRGRHSFAGYRDQSLLSWRCQVDTCDVCPTLSCNSQFQ